MARVFISYRSAVDTYAAALLDRELSAAIGRDEVFYASRCIGSPDNYERTLLAALRDCEVLLVLIGHGWHGRSNENGDRLMERREDWVRREIATVLADGRPVVPILLNGGVLPRAADLPRDVAGLAELEPLSFSNRRIDEDVAGILREITSRLRRELVVRGV